MNLKHPAIPSTRDAMPFAACEGQADGRHQRQRLSPRGGLRALLALGAGLLALSACDKNTLPAGEPTVAPTAVPQVIGPPMTAPMAQGASSGDPSVPEAAAVFPSPVASQPAPGPQPPNSTLSDAQESRSMPLPGQNNDHSPPAKPKPQP